MHTILFISALLGVTYGLEYDGLRVKVGWSDALADKEYFFKIPRSIPEAEQHGWRRTERPPGPIPELRLYCTTGRYVCPLFDSAGFVAGLQLALPVDRFESLAVKPEKHFVKWNAHPSNGEPAREYWTITQYYVSEESLKAGAGPTVENGATLQDGGVWVKGPDRTLMRIPSTVVELNTTKYKKQNCIPNMGTHNYYNFSPDLKCEDLFPWFALTTQGELVGVAFHAFGKLVKSNEKVNWFEEIHRAKSGVELVMPDAPSCLPDWVNSYGIIQLHIYYIDKPWTIRCSTGDSVKPAPALDRLMLTGYRYANQIADELKNLFSG